MFLFYLFSFFFFVIFVFLCFFVLVLYWACDFFFLFSFLVCLFFFSVRGEGRERKWEGEIFFFFFTLRNLWRGEGGEGGCSGDTCDITFVRIFVHTQSTFLARSFRMRFIFDYCWCSCFFFFSLFQLHFLIFFITMCLFSDKFFCSFSFFLSFVFGQSLEMIKFLFCFIFPITFSPDSTVNIRISNT